MKAKLLLLLLALSLTASFVACSGGGKTPSGTETAAPSGESANGWADDLPSDLSFNNADIRILYPESSIEDIFIEDPGGDLVDEAVFRARMTVEDRLKVTYKISTLSQTRDSYSNAVLNTFLGQDDAWDIVADMIAYAAKIVDDGAYADLRALEYIDFSKPYWNQSVADGFTVNGHLYVCSGDAMVDYLRQIYCMLCHKKVASEYQVPEDLQQMALDGKWTAEKMKEYAISAFSGDDPTNVNRETDTVGLLLPERDHATMMATGFGVYRYSPDGNGGYECTYGNAHAVDVIQWMVRLFNENPSCIGTFTVANEDSFRIDREMFNSGRALFVTASFDDMASVYSGIAGDYSVLPLPKWSEEDDYATLSRVIHLASCVMRSSPNQQMAGAVLECMASVGSTLVTPAYFEEALKIKYTDATPTTKAIFNLIHDSVVFDYGVYCQSAFTSSTIYVYTPILNNDLGWSTSIKAHQVQWEKGLRSYIEKLSHLEDEYA